MGNRPILRCVLCLLALAGFDRAEGEEKKIGDESDGSRAHPVHIIPLVTEEGDAIAPDDDPLLPFSTKATCGVCHSYDLIGKGWHFNAADSDLEKAKHGRKGQPWLLVDSATGLQIPLSYRPWEGAFRPDEVGLNSRTFLRIFGRHMPGGAIGEIPSEDPDDIMRAMVSGYLETNCLACHDGDPGHNQGEYMPQVLKENFRWAAAATSSFATVTGSARDMPDTYDPMMPEPLADPKLKPPGIKYAANTFREDGKVLLNIKRQTPNHQCYFCHSNLYMEDEHTEKWTTDEDIHLKAGMTCVDCHRNGIDHNIVRGYEGEQTGNVMAAKTSCKGCHIPEDSLTAIPEAGRFGAPVPKHPGIPAVHFEKISCTGCHSGPWPGDKTNFTKTAMAHRLGTLGVNKTPDALPHIMSPVFATAESGKIAPHKLVWPAYWGDMADANIAPIGFDTVRRVVGKVAAVSSSPWSDEDIAARLKALAGSVKGKAVYVSSGNLYSLNDSGELVTQADHPAAKPYMWPIGHDVRPAAQSLGIRYCTDCHATDAPFFFGDIGVDAPGVVQDAKAVKEMVEFQDVDATYAKMFAMSFVFRSMLKIVSICSCAVLGLVLLLYGLRAL
ncbi:MAG: cytochrome c3 family protein, partial [Planctomycetota bacterium]